MRFSILSTVVAAGSLLSGSMALPLGLPSLSPAQALAVVSNLNTELSGAARSINSTVSAVTPAGLASDKEQAVQQVSAQLQRVTMLVSQGAGKLTQLAAAGTGAVPAVTGGAAGSLTNVTSLASSVSPQDVATALSFGASEVSGVVANAVSVLGAGPLVEALTPLIGAFAGLTSTIGPLVAELQPLLKLANGVPILSNVPGLSSALGELNL